MCLGKYTCRRGRKIHMSIRPLEGLNFTRRLDKPVRNFPLLWGRAESLEGGVSAENTTYQIAPLV